MIYVTKAYKRIALAKSRNPKLEGMYRMVFLSSDSKWKMDLRGNGINNPWLPKDEAEANIREHAERLGWAAEKTLEDIAEEA